MGNLDENLLDELGELYAILHRREVVHRAEGDETKFVPVARHLVTRMPEAERAQLELARRRIQRWAARYYRTGDGFAARGGVLALPFEASYVAAGSTRTIVAAPQVSVRLERLLVTDPRDFVISDVRVGCCSLFAGGGVVPAELYSNGLTTVGLVELASVAPRGWPVHRGQEVSLMVQNLRSATGRFLATFECVELEQVADPLDES